MASCGVSMTPDAEDGATIYAWAALKLLVRRLVLEPDRDYSESYRFSTGQVLQLHRDGTVQPDYPRKRKWTWREDE